MAADISGNYAQLRGGDTLIVLETAQGERPRMLYCGPDLEGTSGEELALLATRQHVPGGPAMPIRISLMNAPGTGIAGPAGLLAHRQGQDWAIDLRVVEVRAEGQSALVLECRDVSARVAATHRLSLDPATGVLTCSTELSNDGEEPLEVEWCASLCLPLDTRLDTLTSFTGRWAGEFQREAIPAFRGSVVRENKAGRTSHDVYPGLFAGTATTREEAGLAAAFHLAWSGNHRWRVDRHSDGEAVVQMGELLYPGELRLGPGESYRTPDCVACFSRAGYGDVSRRLHAWVKDSVLDPRTRGKPRPVHYNTWEALYFNHDPGVLAELVQKAAAVGAERFVLDDGWFGERRSDTAGLGDWWVSPEVYPEGLRPLADQVHGAGMEFGLWFEPEMVNPDSDLYRAHPDWVLKIEGVEPVPSRNQLTLDLTRSEVSDYLFDRLSTLVSELSVDYIKWDMNRDTQHPGSGGRAVMHLQTRSVYALMERLRQAHPALEIESCSSGGARADYGVLRHSDRVWTSDNNDARQRQDIQRGASYFLPLQVLGSHAGPERCHITGRRFTMEYRAASAIFGHMGMELDLREASESELDVLKAGIALYKQHRELIHEGALHRLEQSSSVNGIGCVARDRSEALFSWALTDVQTHSGPGRIRFGGLDASRRYRVQLVWPARSPTLPGPSIIEAAQLMGEGSVFAGSALMDHGIAAPLTFPDTCLIYHLKAEG